MKISVKKTVALLLAGGFVFALGRCSKKTINYTMNPKSSSSVSNTLPTDDNKYALNNTDETIAATISSTEAYTESYELFYSESVYLTLKDAKNNFDNLLNNGEDVSTKMKNAGINLTDEDSVTINDNMSKIYGFICQYVNGYETNNYKDCMEAFNSLSYYYYAGLSKDYLFKILVSNNLPNEYQSSIKYDEYGNMYDSSDNIRLENGKLIRFIGTNDSLINNSNQYYNESENIDLISKWFKNLPSVLFDKYEVINNTTNDSICYFWNETEVCELCNIEYNQVLSDGSNMYGFDVNNAQIICADEDLGKYVFTDIDQNVYGELTYNQNMIIEKIIEIKNAVNSKSGNALVLDSYINNMQNKYEGTYSK